MRMTARFERLVAVMALVIVLALPCQEIAARKREQTFMDVVNTLREELEVRFIYDSSIDLDVKYEKRLPDLRQVKYSGKEGVRKILDEIFRDSGFTYEIHRKYIVLRKLNVKVRHYVVVEDSTMRDVISESRITAFQDQKLRLTQTGMKKIGSDALKSGVAFLSQPDIIKILQLQPGVSSGTELLSGLYVHGGNGKDNLYLMDGVEIYSSSHLAGLFSTFNVDVINHLDFYKSGFPARYGGKLSSVVDVISKEGSVVEHQGTFSIGLLKANIQVDGPIVKGKTSYNIGLRRSWLDPLTAPVFAILNKTNKDHRKLNFRYAMTDFNASVTHRFSNRNRLSLNLYTGQDILLYKQALPMVEYWSGQRFLGENSSDFRMKWGNILASLNWKYDVSDKFAFNLTGYYTHGMSDLFFKSKRWEMAKENGPVITEDYIDDCSNSQIHDTGIKADFFYNPDSGNHITFGTDLKVHLYRSRLDVLAGQEKTWSKSCVPSDIFELQSEKIPYYKEKTVSRYKAGEFAFYAEDEIGYLDWMKLNLGLRYAIFTVPGKTYHKLEPRVALRIDFCPEVTFKASYTDMDQFTHKMSAHTIDLPTFCFLPSNNEISPMHSRQVAAGLYTRLPHDFTLNIEGYYKTMDHLMEYKGQNLFAPTVSDWQKDFSEGKGRAYGLETELSWHSRKTDVTVYYTLSWNERFFGDLYKDWFPDSHDNRHKLTLMFTRQFNRHFDMNISWHYHTGDRITESAYYTKNKNPEFGHDNPYSDPQPEFKLGFFFYSRPNNLKLPDYHRLDIGFNYRKTTRRGNESIWNISIYNAYCHVNAVYAEVGMDNNTSRIVARCYGLIPIVPMFSWTLKF